MKNAISASGYCPHSTAQPEVISSTAERIAVSPLSGDIAVSTSIIAQEITTIAQYGTSSARRR